MEEFDFDPSDVDGAMTLAYRAYRLAQLAVDAIKSDDLGFHMGRDQRMFLVNAVNDVCNTIGAPYPGDNKHGREMASR